MAGPYWVSVAVVFLMIVRNSLSALDQHQLAPVVQEILKRYTPKFKDADDKSFPPMFSVAVSVPYNEKEHKYDMSKVPDSDENVKNMILNCDVYKGDRVVAATVLRWPNVLKQCPDGRVKWTDVRKRCGKQQINSWAAVERLCGKSEIEDGRADHAEYRTLQHVNTLVKKQQKSTKDLMIFYVRASPCYKICTNQTHERNILSSIKEIQKFSNYAFVFSDVFKPKEILEKNLRDSLERLGSSVGGLKNIFRCSPYSKEAEVRCISCYNKSGVTNTCVLDR